jgi:UDP-2,4-diacetamido-2,4,6-trideoxy-beta-L-altropyranose hydrolase
LRFVVRVDASERIGTGHLVRCLTLATALRQQGSQPFFVCRDQPGNRLDLIRARDFDVALVSGALENDAASTRDLLQRHDNDIDWIVVDHYGLDEAWEGQLRPLCRQLMVIDDIADRRHDCDLLLDQNLVEGADGRYDGLVPEHCRRLIGPDFALLDPLYAELRRDAQPRRARVQRVLISFGGSDYLGLTPMALAAFLAAERPDVDADVVVAPQGPYVDDVLRMAAGHDNVHVHSGLPTLAHVIARADLAIGAGGTTSWERLCLGLAAIVVTVADNQRPATQALANRKLVRWIGDHDQITEASFADALQPLLADGIPREWLERCGNIVDGLGVDRVSRSLLTHA